MDLYFAFETNSLRLSMSAPDTKQESQTDFDNERMTMDAEVFVRVF